VIVSIVIVSIAIVGIAIVGIAIVSIVVFSNAGVCMISLKRPAYQLEETS
jgi:hypothetical protein